MEYTINKALLKEGQELYLEIFETEFRQFVYKELKNFPNLAVTPVWQVKERGEKFITIEHNASFDINGSFALVGKLEQHIKNRCKLSFDECSLFLKINIRETENSMEKTKEQEFNPTPAKDDGLPTFLPQTPRFRFEQIILPDETRKRILNDLNTIRHQDLIYNTWGFSEVDSKPKSILNFYGPPGTGKTMCAHAIANYLEKPLLALNYSEIESKFVGDAAKNLKKAFDTATQLNAVMFFDEADSFLGKRIENVSHGSDQALNSLRSQMLILLEEFEGVVLFATNLVTNFDKAFESRILDHIKLDLPNKEARAEIIEKMIPAKLPVDHPFSKSEYLEASELIEGFAGREIKGAILSMLLNKASQETDNLIFTFCDLKDALIKKKEQLELLKKEESEKRKEKIVKRLQEKMEEDAAVEEEKNKRRIKSKFKTKKR